MAFAFPFQDRNPNVYGDLDKLLASLPEADRPALIARAAAMRPLAANLALIEEATALEHDTFVLQYGPVAPQWTTHETMAAIAEASRETGRRVHMHLLETRWQREWADHHYPDGLIVFLDTLGILSPRLAVAHGVWLREDEAALLAERGVTVSVNMSSNWRLRSGSPPITALRRACVPLGFGLDGMSFEDDEDMLRELRLVWHGQVSDPGAMTPGELFSAATTGARRTIVADEGGAIAPGMPADLLTLDFAAMTSDCVTSQIDVIGILLTRMKAAHLRLLLVGGKPVVVDGRCVSVDADALEAELTAAAKSALAAMPPDTAAIARLREGVASFYAAGCHCADNGIRP